MTVAPQRPARTLPGRADMWLFVIGDLWIFTCYFAAFMVDRGRHPAEFLRGPEQLGQLTGMTATVVLLTSSLFVARAVQAARRGPAGPGAVSWLTAGGALGVVFLGLKALEWARLISAGHTLGSDRFFLHYFMLTGLHGLHVAFGLGVLAYAGRGSRLSSSPITLLEVGATYWHLVDLLWIVVFALLYLVR